MKFIGNSDLVVKWNRIDRCVRDVRGSTWTFVDDGIRIGRFQHGQRWFWIDLPVQRNNRNQKWWIRQTAQRTLLVHHIVAFVLANLNETKTLFSMATIRTWFSFWIEIYLIGLMPTLLLRHRMFIPSTQRLHRNFACNERNRWTVFQCAKGTHSMCQAIPFCSLSMAPFERCLPVLWPLFVCFSAPVRWTWWSTPISYV